LTSITTLLPSGYSYSYSNGVFSGSNVNGTDISSAQTTDNDVTTDAVTDIATLTFTLAPDTSVGTVLSLPSIEADSTLTGNANNPIAFNRLSMTTAPTVVAPEPPTFWMILLGISVLGLLGGVRLSPASRSVGNR
jgi:hypothetical protein